MSRSFSYDLSLPETPTDTQARIRRGVTDQLRQTANMRLAKEQSNSLTFRPQWSWPLLATLYRIISGETVEVNLSAIDNGTRVAVSGRVAGGAEKVADRQFWAHTLGAT